MDFTEYYYERRLLSIFHDLSGFTMNMSLKDELIQTFGCTCYTWSHNGQGVQKDRSSKLKTCVKNRDLSNRILMFCSANLCHFV